MSDRVCIGNAYQDCNEKAVWMRSTQFAGDHPFCDFHARQEDDFDEENSSYYYWYAIE